MPARSAVAEDAEAFASIAAQLIADRGTAEALGAAARARVIDRYGWDARLAPLDDLIGLPDRMQDAA